MWLTRASTLQKEGSQVAQFNLTPEEEAHFFEGYSADIRDLVHDYLLALRPCREKGSLFLLTMWLTRASTLQKEGSQVTQSNLT